jgi:hypothetical protein
MKHTYFTAGPAELYQRLRASANRPDEQIRFWLPPGQRFQDIYKFTDE